VTASRKRNVIPARAEVVCDCRVLPGTTVDELHGDFRAALEGLEFELEPVEEPMGGTRSPLGTPLEEACRSFVDRLEPGALVVPTMCVGFTDSHFLRQAFGTVALGFLPFRYTDPILAAETIHSADERIRRDDLVVAVEFIEHACRSIGGLS
jgi:acetylornithine deacetylase/succinyl-diaminopimelate desuccinylase-like protein